MTTKTKLYSAHGLGHFPDGTLFELPVGPEGVTLPDRGDGERATIVSDKLVECRPFEANVPPGQCPVAVTSFSGDAAVTLDESIHFQVLIVPGSVGAVVVTDRAKMFEADSYSAGSSGDHFRLHIGHLPPGFYEAAITFADGSRGRLTFIKFFPAHFVATAMPAAVEAKPRTVSMNPEADLLNKALELATEWGENYQKPIHDRLRVFYPALADKEIDKLTKQVREAEYYIYKLAEWELAGKITEADIRPKAHERYPWLSDRNVARLSSIGMYYARR